MAIFNNINNNNNGHKISPHDVLCGRGGATNMNAGNIRFRQMVSDCQPEYLVSQKKEKGLISRRIVAQVRRNGGRFLKRNGNTGEWVDIGNKKAVEKTTGKRTWEQTLQAEEKKVKTPDQHKHLKTQSSATSASEGATTTKANESE